MKLKKTIINFKKIFELYLIKQKVYEQPIRKNILEKLPDTSLQQTILEFKKSLQIIYTYHKKKKRILFLGTPDGVRTNLGTETKHTFLPDSVCTRKLQLSNVLKSNVKFNSRLKAEKKIFLHKIQNKPDLIVVFGLEETKYKDIIKEGFKYKIPVINFSENSQKNNSNNCYTVSGNLSELAKKNIHNICFTVVNAMFKKSARKNTLNL